MNWNSLATKPVEVTHEQIVGRSLLTREVIICWTLGRRGKPNSTIEEHHSAATHTKWLDENEVFSNGRLEGALQLECDWCARGSGNSAME